jgi:hypothetical protein
LENGEEPRKKESYELEGTLEIGFLLFLFNGRQKDCNLPYLLVWVDSRTKTILIG